MRATEGGHRAQNVVAHPSGWVRSKHGTMAWAFVVPELFRMGSRGGTFSLRGLGAKTQKNTQKKFDLGLSVKLIKKSRKSRQQNSVSKSGSHTKSTKTQLIS